MSILDLYSPEDLLCVVTLPPFMDRRQRFVKVRDLKAEKWQKFLRAANAQESNIYLSVYPLTISERTEDSVVDTVDRIFLDFDVLEPYQHFRHSYQPSVVIQTSPGKHQCFLFLSESVPKAEAKAISRALSKKYDADKTFDLARVFRYPGFRNVKYSDRPLAVVIEENNITYSAFNLPVMHDEANTTPEARGTAKGSLQDPTRSPEPCYDYQHFLDGVPNKISGDPNYSQADWRFCVYLFSFFDSAEVRQRILAESPDLHKRKKGGLENYLTKTLQRAENYQKSNYREYEERVGR